MKIIDFDLYANLLKEQSGLSLTQDKSYLLESRLGPIAKKWGFASLDAMTVSLQGVPDKGLINDIMEAMTTNETSFFRDTKPFDLFKGMVMDYMKTARSGPKKLRIWCAAASSGQEPYTLSILLHEMMPQLPGWKFEIVATDISQQIIDQAKTGIYSQFEVQRGMPTMMLMKYFTKIDDRWQVKDNVKSLVQYSTFNLLHPMDSLGTFDLIFCRNVLIYFDQQTKGKVLENMKGRLSSDGFLFLGGAETVIGVTEDFKVVPDQRGLYALSNSPHVSGSGSAQVAAQ
ncbi:MAG: protein-glutamate O-methyltransferase CheR [Micavibrio sp.]|nr:protein-glutamate O-methyltransferase CheR [Micavibrio sp.]